MLDSFGLRQQDILKLMLENKEGVTVDELSQSLNISRNAVRQHLAVLERDGLVLQFGARPSKGRPELLYGLANKGKEAFPRRYSWFAELLMTALINEVGHEGLNAKVAEMGNRVASELRAGRRTPASTAESIKELNVLMRDLGYSSKVVEDDAGELVIEASNCVFHDLASKHSEVCEFDLALMTTFTQSEVCHEECMVRGGKRCRFKFKSSQA